MATEERTVLGELDHLEFSGRVNELRLSGRISREAEMQLMGMAEASSSIDEFKTRFAYTGPRIMDVISQRFLTSALDTPEGQAPDTLAQAATWVRAHGLDPSAPEAAAEPPRQWEPQGLFAELNDRGFAPRMTELRSVDALTEDQQNTVMQFARDSDSLSEFAAKLQYTGAQVLRPFAYKYLTSVVVDEQPATWTEAGEWVRSVVLAEVRPTTPEVATQVNPDAESLLHSAFPVAGSAAVTEPAPTVSAPAVITDVNRAIPESALSR